MDKHEMATTNTGFLTLLDNDFAQMMAEELDGLDSGFERIKIPSAGSTVFEVPGEDPSEPDTVKEFSAVILFHHPLYAYYASAYTGGNNPPDCGSFDGITGEGNPGGACEKCPYNQFGSAPNGGKSCKNRRRIFLLREGEIFPLLLSLPTGSLRPFTAYIKRQLGKGRRTNHVVTRFSLQKATNAGGIAYSQAQFAVDRLLTQEEHAAISSLSEQVKAYSKRIALEYDNAVYASGEEELIDPDTGEIITPLA
ncbi:hypothetical protein LJC74_03610 [Eubacteriales bacterium OttesenSCG-928-A19]|nr:hypothetical protein [Eubacteriales bacterium OttesenSCG-928-A19]